MNTFGKGWSTETPLLTRYHSTCAFKVALITIFLSSFGWLEQSVAAGSPLDIGLEDARGTLLEIKDRHRVALLISRSSVINASESDDPIVAEALASEPGEARRRHRYAYASVARKLNEYMRKYRSMRPVYEIAQADFIIYFKLVEYRRLLNGYYPYGELFIIVTPPPEERRPARVIWKTREVSFADDAVRDFLKELKRVRGER